MMFGFSFGLVMLMFVVFFPVAYLVSYAATSFDAWRLGNEIPKHKIKVNIILSVIIGIVFGGVFQYISHNESSRRRVCERRSSFLILMSLL